MQPTREQILTYLEHHPPTSADELGRYLEMTPANIRYHLEILNKAGLVEVSGTRPTGGAGRPIQLYRLTSNSLGENLGPLLAGFLSHVAKVEDPDQLLAGVVEQIIQGKLDEGKNQIERLNQGIDFLNSRHYHASWEARPQGPWIELRHCPYRDLAQRHPILCQLDHTLLERVFNAQLVMLQVRTQGDNALQPCIFQAT